MNLPIILPVYDDLTTNILKNNPFGIINVFLYKWGDILRPTGHQTNCGTIITFKFAYRNKSLNIK